MVTRSLSIAQNNDFSLKMLRHKLGHIIGHVVGHIVGHIVGYELEGLTA